MRIVVAAILVLMLLSACAPVDDYGRPLIETPQVREVMHCAYASQNVTNLRRCIDRELGVVCYVYGPNVSDDGGRSVACLPIPTSGGEE